MTTSERESSARRVQIWFCNFYASHIASSLLRSKPVVGARNADASANASGTRRGVGTALRDCYAASVCEQLRFSGKTGAYCRPLWTRTTCNGALDGNRFDYVALLFFRRGADFEAVTETRLRVLQSVPFSVLNSIKRGGPVALSRGIPSFARLRRS
jgi:hypothetical protein